MILFLNFVPIEFMGGAEKWMSYTAQKINRLENTRIASVHPRIANLYGGLVLKRKYASRIRSSNIHNHTSLDFQSFIPFTKQWRDARDTFIQARLIYTRYEVLELVIVLYFSGLSGLRKTVSGIHSPFVYSDPISFFDKLHNTLYCSSIYKFILKKVRSVHVLNTKDEIFFKNVFKLKNVIYVPNGADAPNLNQKNIPSNKSQLSVLFVGELSLRKGVDVLISIIKNAPKDIVFTIAGDGHLKNEIEALATAFSNVKYQGHINKNRLNRLYLQNDVLILPSRAESMSLALLEAMSFGLTIVDSKDIELGLDKYVEYSCNNKSIKTYADTLKMLSKKKKVNKLNRSYIKTYFSKRFSFRIVDPILFKNVFEINV